MKVGLETLHVGTLAVDDFAGDVGVADLVEVPFVGL